MARVLIMDFNFKVFFGVVMGGFLIHAILPLLPKKQWIYILFSAIFGGAINSFAYYTGMLTQQEAMLITIPVCTGIGFWMHNQKNKEHCCSSKA